MKKQPTPGPWEYTGIYIEHEGDVVAHTYINTVSEEECKANARLIAAAPDLLAALKETLLILETHPKILNGATARFAAQRAIARAEGRTR